MLIQAIPATFAGHHDLAVATHKQERFPEVHTEMAVGAQLLAQGLVFVNSLQGLTDLAGNRVDLGYCPVRRGNSGHGNKLGGGPDHHGFFRTRHTRVLAGDQIDELGKGRGLSSGANCVISWEREFGDFASKLRAHRTRTVGTMQDGRGKGMK